MKDYIETNIEIVKELINIDNKIMNEKIELSNLIEHSFISSNLVLNNSLIFYDGNPYTTLKLINSNIENSILYPNGNFLAINRFIASYKDNIHLCIEHNDFKYDKAKEVFENIIVLNDKVLYEEIRSIYPTAQYIEI